MTRRYICIASVNLMNALPICSSTCLTAKEIIFPSSLTPLPKCRLTERHTFAGSSPKQWSSWRSAHGPCGSSAKRTIPWVSSCGNQFRWPWLRECHIGVRSACSSSMLGTANVNIPVRREPTCHVTLSFESVKDLLKDQQMSERCSKAEAHDTHFCI